MKIAMMGTRGVPARYGGFETAVEEIGTRLVSMGHDVLVYSRARHNGASYRGMEVVVLPSLRLKQLETLSHTALSVAHSLLRVRPDAVILFNAANSPLLLPLRLASIPTAVHVDGLEWKRAKWAGLGTRYYMFAEKQSVRWSDEVIADAEAIARYIYARYKRQCRYIAYGAPRVYPDPVAVKVFGVNPRGYHLLVSRLEPENHVYELVQGYVRSRAQLPLLLVGFASYRSEYASALSDLASSDQRIQMLGPIWSKDLLDQLYANSMTYLHGHSVGGTNPSLLRALGAGAPVIAWDVEFNRETTCGYAEFVSSIEHVSATLASVEGSPEGYLARASQVAELAATKYSWDTVADDYAIMCKALVEKHEPSTTRRSKSIVRETEPGTVSSGRPCEEEDRVRHGRQVWLQELRRESRPSFNE